MNYDDHSSLVSGLKGQDALIITMATSAPKDTQLKLVTAAAEAGVKYVMPNHWGPDVIYEREMGKESYLGFNLWTIIEGIEKAGLIWMSPCSGFWYEFSLAGDASRFGFDSVALVDRARGMTELLSRPQSDRIVLRAGRVLEVAPPDWRELDAVLGMGPG